MYIQVLTHKELIYPGIGAGLENLQVKVLRLVRTRIELFPHDSTFIMLILAALLKRFHFIYFLSLLFPHTVVSQCLHNLH